MSEYEISDTCGKHEIVSENVLTELDTGRVVAVFYNDYDLADVVEKMAATKEKHLRESIEQIPATWLDPLLSGDKSVIKDSSCPEIEALLLGIKKRIENLIGGSDEDNSARASN